MTTESELMLDLFTESFSKAEVQNILADPARGPVFAALLADRQIEYRVQFLVRRGGKRTARVIVTMWGVVTAADVAGLVARAVVQLSRSENLGKATSYICSRITESCRRTFAGPPNPAVHNPIAHMSAIREWAIAVPVDLRRTETRILRILGDTSATVEGLLAGAIEEAYAEIGQ